MSFSEVLTKLNLVGVALANGITEGPDSPLGSEWENIAAVFAAITNLVFYVGIAMTIIFLIIGGIRYITSGGSKEGAEAARGMITNAVIGFVVVLGAFAVKAIITNLMGADVTEPGWWRGD